MVVTVYSNDDSLDWTAKGIERIVQNVRNLLRTRTYEVPFMREMGIDADFMDSNHRKLKSDLENHIKELVATYEDRATVLNVSIESVDSDGEYIIAVKLEV